MRNLVSAKYFISVILSSFSLCGTVISLHFFSLSHPFHTALLCLVSLFIVAVVVLCVNVCVSILLGTRNSRHVSFVILISSPQGTGELFKQQYSPSLQTIATESALLYCLVVCPIDNSDLYLYLHLFVILPISSLSLSHSQDCNRSQYPHDIYSALYLFPF